MIIRLIVYGINSIALQTIIIREIISNFYSNEFFISISLFGWLISCIIGVIIGERFIIKTNVKRFIEIYHIITPIIGAFSVLYIRKINIYFLPLGETFNFHTAIIISFSSSLIYSLINGAYYSAASNIENSNYVKTYYLESIGYAIGGILIYFAFIYTEITTFEILFFLLVLNTSQLQKNKFILLILLLINTSLLYYLNKNYSSSHIQNKKIIQTIQSPYSKIEVFKTQNETLIYSNSSLVSSTIKDFTSQRNALISIYYTPNPQKVVLLNPDINLIKEFKKYGINEIYLVEKDEKLVKTLFKYSLLSPNEIKIFLQNPNYFFKTQKDLDIVILPPYIENSYFSYIYTKNFLEIIKNSLSKNAQILIQIPLNSYSSNPINKKIMEIIKLNIKSVFKYAYQHADDNTLIIATQSEPLENIIKTKNLIEKKYLDYIKETKKEIYIEKEKKNLLIQPNIFVYSTLAEISKYYPKISLFISNNSNMVFSLVLILILFFFISLIIKFKTTSLISISSFILTFFQIYSIFIINSKYGSIYSDILILISCVMIGLSIGTISIIKIGKIRFIVLFLLSLIILFSENKYIIYAIIFIISFLNGNLFSFLTKELPFQKYKVYLQDILGGALGILISSFFIIGFGGREGCFLLITILNLIILLYVFFISKITY